MQRKFRTPRRIENHSESSSGYRKSSNRDIVCYECNEQGHYKSDYPNIQKEKPKKKFFKEKKKTLMATWDDSKSSKAETESEDERANIAQMANLSDDSGSYELESESKVFSNFSRSQLEKSLSEILERYQQLRVNNKNLKKDLVSDSEETKKLRTENYELKEKFPKLKNKL